MLVMVLVRGVVNEWLAVLVSCWFHSSSMTSQPVMTRTAVL
ncbi:hypothetical protein [Mycobacterium lepromatosis]|nr:hypothetical protein [Mycobacterium lepromatosis]